MTNIPEIEQAKLDFLNFRGNKSPTDDELVDQVLDTKGIYSIKSIEKDGKLFRKRGCRYECACTGLCQELVPFTELDEMCHKHYESVKNILHSELYKQNRVHKVEA